MTAIPSLFSELNLSAPLLKVLSDVGYEAPSPIQAQTIPHLLANRDVLGTAQTGTGKTAAFALPILSRLDIRQVTPQALVLAPTRELAIQVAEAFQRYAANIPNFHVLPIYGGQSYGPQLSALRRGVHVVVGTPGRVIDHLDKGSLDLSKLKTLVLDEADEMLRMGFIDDVERILKETPASRQTALFSATMPSAIRRIANTYLRDPAEITVAAKTTTSENITQRYWLVSGMHKLDALTRILEAEPFDGMIVFSRTKIGTEELAERLAARGFSAAAINGDMQQAARERTIGQLKEGKIDILVATDVAARGLDVERISHVVNYDVPYDAESYTHRIGRTGRAGRTGDAIMFITPRERTLLKTIERATRQPIKPMDLPTLQAVNDVRIARFKDQITETLAEGGLEQFQALVADYEREHDVPASEIAAALAKLARGNTPLLLDKKSEKGWHEDGRPATPQREERGARPERGDRGDRGDRGERFERPERAERPAYPKKERIAREPEPGMATYRIEVGYEDGVKPGNIVGAIANEGGVDSKFIGRIEIFEDYTVLDMPADLAGDVLDKLTQVRVAGRPMRIRRDGEPAAGTAAAAAPAKAKAAPKAAPEAASRPAQPAAPAAAQAVARTVAQAVEPKGLDAVVAGAVEEEAPKKKRVKAQDGLAMRAYRIEVGSSHEATPSNIVGAIANESGLEARYIGRIEIFEDHTVLEMPDGMPDEIFRHLGKVWVGGQQLKISKADAMPPQSGKHTPPKKPVAGKPKAKR